MWAKEVIETLKRLGLSVGLLKKEVGGYVHNPTAEINKVEDPVRFREELIYLPQDKKALEAERLKAQDGWLVFFMHTRGDYPAPSVIESYISCLRGASVFVGIQLRDTAGIFELRPITVLPTADILKLDDTAWETAKKLAIAQKKALGERDVSDDKIAIEEIRRLWQQQLAQILSKVIDVIPVMRFDKKDKESPYR